MLFFHDGLEVNKVVVTRLLFYAHTSYHIKLTVLITVQFFKLRFAYRQIYPLIMWFIWFDERSFLCAIRRRLLALSLDNKLEKIVITFTQLSRKSWRNIDRLFLNRG